MIFVGIGEEMFSRGYCMSILRRSNIFVVLIVPNVIFALLHILNNNIGVIPPDQSVPHRSIVLIYVFAPWEYLDADRLPHYLELFPGEHFWNASKRNNCKWAVHVKIHE